VIRVIPVTLQIAVPSAILQMAVALVALVTSAVRRRGHRERGQRSCSWRVSLEIHRMELTAEAGHQDDQPPVGAAAQATARPEQKPLARLPAPR